MTIREGVTLPSPSKDVPLYRGHSRTLPRSPSTPLLSPDLCFNQYRAACRLPPKRAG
jgi:hypothetical protein